MGHAKDVGGAGGGGKDGAGTGAGQVVTVWGVSNEKAPCRAPLGH